MPRRKILGPATATQVLDYFKQSNMETTNVLYELVTDIVKDRRLMSAQNARLAEQYPNSTMESVPPRRRRRPTLLDVAPSAANGE